LVNFVGLLLGIQISLNAVPQRSQVLSGKGFEKWLFQISFKMGTENFIGLLLGAGCDAVGNLSFLRSFKGRPLIWP
jgi:hypothetical protein